MFLEMLCEFLLGLLEEWLLKSKIVRLLLVFLPVGCLLLTGLIVAVMLREKSWIVAFTGINMIAFVVMGTVFCCRDLCRRNK